MKNVLLVLSLVAALASSLGFGADAARKALTFGAAEGLKPGRTTKEEVRKALGSPSEVTDLSKGTNGRKDLGELWEYREGESIRVEVSFLPAANVLETWTWHVPEKSSDQNLRTAMGRYVSAAWEAETVKWINPHSFPNECYFEDKKLGVTIEYNRARKEVFTITRYDPSRKLASDEEEKPPQYCMAIDPSLCTPAISSKEFFKDKPISKYCEIPAP